MSRAVAAAGTPTPAVPLAAAARAPDSRIAWLGLPLLATLLVVFVLPLIWFFVRVIGESGGIGAFAELTRHTLSTGAVPQAMVLTLWTSAVVTAATIFVAYPMAYVLSQARGLLFSLIILCVVLPYFTSIIVRTYAWMVLLGSQGLINKVLLGLGLIGTPLPLLYNTVGVVIGMTYVLLPYMVLTLYAAMRSIDLNLVRAAFGMGASGAYAFWRVFLPLSMHGVLSGSLIVFILALGFFITPALMGGPSNITIAMLIEREVELSMNWPVAGAMSLVLLAVTLVLYAVYTRFTDLQRMLR